MIKNKILYIGNTFDDQQLVQGDCLLVHSDLSDSLAANALEFDIRSEDMSLLSYKEGDPLVYYHDGELVGTFYLQSVDRIGQSTIRFSALSAVGLMIEKRHYGGMYTGQTAETVINSICSSAGVPVEIKTIFLTYQIYGWLPEASARDNLSQVLFAIGASLKTLSNGTLRVTSLYTGPSWVRGPEKCYTGGSVEYGKPVSRVIVTEHQWDAGSEDVDLFNGSANEGDIIRFSEPVHSLKATSIKILESNCNYAKVSGGAGTLTGKKYVHNMRDVIRTVSGAGKEVTVTDAYLVSVVNSAGVAERLAEYYSHTERITQDVVWGGEHAGDIVRTAHPYGGDADVFLSSADLTMSGVLKSKEEGVIGYVPPSPESMDYYDSFEVLTGSGTWTAPEDAKSAHIVLISGGSGGAKGSSGSAGTVGTTEQITDEYTGSKRYTTRQGPGSGGEGGAAGAGGSGGKVRIIEIELTPGQKINYSCGSGGTSGLAGGDTVFGSYSSSSGQVMPSGYYDSITGKTYAKPGTAGIPGGKGSGGTTTNGYYVDVPGTNVVYNNVTYKPGSKGSQTTDDRTYEYYGGYGGGPAAGKNGNAGGTIKGGSGAAAVVPAAKTDIGTGGDGGNGGGGGGGGGAGQQSTFALPYPPGPSSAGSAGAGSAGGQGGPGGIIIHFTGAREHTSGRFLARGATPFFSQARRTFAV